jgi:hypothetical protein
MLLHLLPVVLLLVPLLLLVLLVQLAFGSARDTMWHDRIR